MDPVLDRYLRQNRGRFLQELKRLVRFPSVSAQPAHRRDLEACARWVVSHLRQMGLAVRLHSTAGHPIIVARSPRSPNPGAPTVLIYGHYDVQPPDPLAQWRTPPFEPAVRAGRLYGRGASDNKGQFFAHVKAVESLLRTRTSLPANVIFLIEGEEETGSHSLAPFLRRHARQLRADYILISDSGMFARGMPAISYGTRGLVALEVRVDGPGRDLHSGVFGGSVANPALVLACLLASCVDDNGRVAVPGFYDDVLPLEPWERRQLARLPFDERAYTRFVGAPALAGEKGYSTLERRWARPTFEVNGIFGGYQGAGGKTVIPSWAGAKITCRLVPGQRPEKIGRLVAGWLRRNCPRSVRLTIATGQEAPPFLTSPRGPGARAAAAALEQAFGRRPVLIREGGTLPIIEALQRQAGGEIVVAGLGLPDDNWHAPNEKMDLANFYGGVAMSLEFLCRLPSRRQRRGQRHPS